MAGDPIAVETSGTLAMSPPGRIPLFRAVVPDAARERLLRTIDTGWIGYGPECRRLEEAFMHGRAGWALATSSCLSQTACASRMAASDSAERPCASCQSPK